MKKWLFVLFIFMLSVQASGQDVPPDSLLKKIAVEKNDSKRIDLILTLFQTYQESDPVQDMEYAKKLLQQSHDQDDEVGEALALSELGYAYRALGNTVNGLDYNLKALATAEQTDNDELIGYVNINLAHYYKDMGDYNRAIALYQKGNELSAIHKSYKVQSWALMNLGEVYYAMNKTDSALIYSQRAYELCISIKYPEFISFICLQLAKVHGKLGNESLAKSYYEMALNEARKLRSPKYVNLVYFNMARYYHSLQQEDTSIYFARQAIETTTNTAFSNMSMRPAKLLADLYEKKNSDSAYKYVRMYMLANDSLFNAKAIQQTQLLSFENSLRQQELAAEKEEAAEKRWQNIQYALIALGIVCFLMIYLLLSHGFISNTRIIEFLGMIALLLVFEFLNLLLHPFLEKITHHSPILMLLALVCIAGLLIPLHHKLQKWATEKLIEKNVRIRLASAKKTIRKLSKDVPPEFENPSS